MTEHQKKYAALIKEMGGLEKVKLLLPVSLQTIEKAIKKDRHLNTIKLDLWDEAAGAFCLTDNQNYGSGRMRQDLGFPKKWDSLCQRVCILKEAARQLTTI